MSQALAVIAPHPAGSHALTLPALIHPLPLPAMVHALAAVHHALAILLSAPRAEPALSLRAISLTIALLLGQDQAGGHDQ